MTTLELKNVVKRYSGEAVLNGLSLQIADGETIALFGPSGAGKTVMLRLIAGVVHADEGQVLIDGRDMAEVEAEHRGIGMAFQNFALFPHMKAFANIASPLEAHRQPKDVIRSAVEQVAKLLKIDHVLDHFPRELSNGQKQRTSLARALVGSRPILLLDDPLRNVDAKLRFEMRLELPRLLADQGATVIYVTQDYKEAMALGDRIAVMAEGRIQQIGLPEDIYHSPANIEIARLFGDPTINLLDVVPNSNAGGVFVEISNIPTRIGDAHGKCIGQSCVLGLRPEAIRFVDEGAAAAIPVLVEAETPLNEKTVTLAVTKGGREILISRPAGTPGPADGPAHIAIDGAAALLFDRAGGARIGSHDETTVQSGKAA